MVLGAIVSATDPVAVLALLQDASADEKLATVVSGESLLNDGAAVVLFKLFLDFATGCGCENDGWYVVSFILRNTLAGPAIGAAFAIAALFWLARTRDPIVETVIILCVAYLSYITADGVALSSGVLAVVTGALILADLGRLSVTGEGEVMTKHTWHVIEYIANSLVFFLAGTIMGYHAAGPNPGMGGRAYVGAYSVAWGLVLYLFVLLIRAVIIGLAFPYMSRTAYKWTWKEAVVLWWGGLRGAVGLSLALSLQETAERGSRTASTTDDIDQFVANRFLAYTSIITIMTLVLHGPTTKPLMKFINILDEEKEVELNILMRQHLHHETIEYWKDHQRDPLLGIDAIREVVQRYVCFLDEDDSAVAAKFKYSAKSVAARARRPRREKLSMTSLKAESESDVASEDASAVAAAGPPPASEGGLRSGASSAKSFADALSFPRSPTPAGWAEWAEKAGDAPGLDVGVPEADPDSYRDLTPRILTAMVDAGSRYLSAIKVQYWLLREAGLLSRTGALVLMDSVDRALDDVYAGANGPEELRVEHILTDWKHLGDLTFKETDAARYDPAARPVGQRLNALWGWVRKATAEVTGFLIGYNLGNDWRGAVPFSLELAVSSTAAAVRRQWHGNAAGACGRLTPAAVRLRARAPQGPAGPGRGAAGRRGAGRVREIGEPPRPAHAHAAVRRVGAGREESRPRDQERHRRLPRRPAHVHLPARRSQNHSPPDRHRRRHGPGVRGQREDGPRDPRGAGQDADGPPAEATPLRVGHHGRPQGPSLGPVLGRGIPQHQWLGQRHGPAGRREAPHGVQRPAGPRGRPRVDGAAAAAAAGGPGLRGQLLARVGVDGHRRVRGGVREGFPAVGREPEGVKVETRPRFHICPASSSCWTRCGFCA